MPSSRRFGTPAGRAPPVYGRSPGTAVRALGFGGAKGYHVGLPVPHPRLVPPSLPRASRQKGTSQPQCKGLTQEKRHRSRSVPRTCIPAQLMVRLLVRHRWVSSRTAHTSPGSNFIALLGELQGQRSVKVSEGRTQAPDKGAPPLRTPLFHQPPRGGSPEPHPTSPTVAKDSNPGGNPSLLQRTQKCDQNARVNPRRSGADEDSQA